MGHFIIDYIITSRSGLFDIRYYLHEYPDIRRADADPLAHYLKTGWKEGRNPSASFDTQYYLDSNPDVIAAGVNPLLHYVRFGRREGRSTSAAPVVVTPPVVESTAQGITSPSARYDFSPVETSFKNRQTDVSVIIPTRNGGALFEKTLRALAGQKFAGEIEIVVIDSESTDNTVEFAKSYGARVISIKQSDFNHGLTRNEAVRNSSGDVLVFLSQDSIPGDEHFIANITSAFADPLIAGAYARQVPRENADIFTRRDLSNWFTGRADAEVRWIKDFDAYERLSPLERYFFCNFDDVASAMRKTAWQMIPFARNEFGEDIEWSKDALEAGWKIAYVPSAYVVHSHNKTCRYEYSRNVLGHKKLYSEFGLWTVPTLGHALRSIIAATKINAAYARGNLKDRRERIRVLLRVPGLSIAGVMGQYQGARAARKIAERNGKNHA